ncbi:fused MFS/spermidine synthase [Gemmata sp. JC673]|uniref:Fused MFS/spermidine synthase n=1 Tax=Gemmata algarum TaxID=2975278 RepID=A0ABU5ESR1_9BACT|nr:fused MFS/spermidine synthase [Gemmata algarum]MDY3557993.1 fused MFS/spermidine synthase [Gemmata algarum]
MLAVLYATTLFAGAALLFLVQPLVGKLLLPLVGGTPGVWNTCMVFFQSVLLVGYLYAHRSTGRLGVRRQALFHLLLLAAVAVSFKAAIAVTGAPVPVVPSMLPDDQDSSVLMVAQLGLTVGVAVGLPFLVLSTTSPLLQRWFAATGHPAARDPYFLYAASNAGSLLGLLAYPLLIEPRLALKHQQWVFAGGVMGYIGLVVACALTVVRGGSREAPHEAGAGIGPEPPAPVAPIAAPRVARWVMLAALPSSLLLGVTTHVSTDLAPVPLLWVVPLALYLVSFILVFARWPDGVHRFVGRVTPMLLLFVVLTLLTNAAEPLAVVGLLHMLAFFGVCLVCHGELAKDRPPAEHLTAFYFWMSLGGVIGGTFNALLAPILFSAVGMVEYPLALVLAAAVRPRSADPEERLKGADVALVLVLLALSVGLVLAVQHLVRVPAEPDAPDALTARLLRGGLMFGLPGAAAFALVRKPARYALALAAILAAGAFDTGHFGETLHKERNFFGVIRVTRDGKFVKLIHGTTLHGQQRADEPGPPRPMTYYHQKGPVGHLFASLPPERVKSVGVVGLGTGAVAAYARPGQKWTFYEIDPAVVRVARDTRYFRFLSECRGACDVVLGDARRHLTKPPDGCYDVIILDGFCSDAIPVHLLTREAIALYVSKLAPRGVIAMHVSNNHLDLPPLIRRLADDHSPKLAVRYCHDVPLDAERADGKTDSQWMLLARADADLAPVLDAARAPAPSPLVQAVAAASASVAGVEWTRPAPHTFLGQWREVELEDGPIWRDDFANLLRVWKKREEE